MSVYLIDYENVHAAGLAGVEQCNIEDEIILLYGNNTSTISMELHIQLAASKAKLQYHKIERTGKNYLDFQLSTIAGYLVGTTKQTEFVIVSNDSGFDAVLNFWNQQKMADRELHFVRKESIGAETAAEEKKEDKTRKKRRSNRSRNTKKNQKPETVTENITAPEVVAENVDMPDASEGVGTENVEIEKVTEEPKVDTVTEKPVKEKSPELREATRKKIRAAVKGLELKPTDYTKIYKECRNSTDKQELHQNLVHSLKQDLGGQVYKAIVGVLF